MGCVTIARFTELKLWLALVALSFASTACSCIQRASKERTCPRVSLDSVLSYSCSFRGAASSMKRPTRPMVARRPSPPVALRSERVWTIQR